MSGSPIREAALGRWRGILPAFGLTAKALSGKHGPCPLCGGKDRFRFDDKEGRGTWICSRCGAGDGLSLVMAVAGLEFRDAVERIEAMIGSVPRLKPKVKVPETDQRAAMNAVWISGSTIRDGDPVARYLAARVGATVFPSCLRSVERMRLYGDPITYHPGMVAMVSDADGKPVNLQRTFLTEDGHKAEIDEPRRLMPGKLPYGSAVRLFPAAEAMGVAKGVETALAAASMFGLPVWAALSARNMAEWMPPPGTAEVFVFGDNDESFTGQAAAYVLARRVIAKGMLGKVVIPRTVGFDWADVWRQQKRPADPLTFQSVLESPRVVSLPGDEGQQAWRNAA